MVQGLRLPPKQLTSEERLEKAQAYKNPQGRQWLPAERIHPYATLSSDWVEFYVLEGTPPHGFLIHTQHFTARFNYEGRRIWIWRRCS